jgi:hypothetical protein
MRDDAILTNTSLPTKRHRKNYLNRFKLLVRKMAEKIKLSIVINIADLSPQQWECAFRGLPC